MTGSRNCQEVKTLHVVEVYGKMVIELGKNWDAEADRKREKPQTEYPCIDHLPAPTSKAPWFI